MSQGATTLGKATFKQLWEGPRPAQMWVRVPQDILGGAPEQRPHVNGLSIFQEQKGTRVAGPEWVGPETGKQGRGHGVCF